MSSFIILTTTPPQSTKIQPDSTLPSTFKTFLLPALIDSTSLSARDFACLFELANSNRHAKSLADKLVESIKAGNKNVLNVEGKVESGWILVDCGGVVVNIMKEDIREFYDLEGLWGENTLLNSSNQ